MLYDYQLVAVDAVFAAWQEPNVFDVMLVMPTGGGKTVCFCDILMRFNAPAIVVAHRQELVAQASLALNREHVPHAVIAPKTVIREIIAAHHERHGYSSYSYRAPVRVAGVDTLKNHDPKDRWLSQVGLVVTDEGHHLLAKNKWGLARGMFPHARGLAVTAHALRADSSGLGRHADGVIDRIVLAPAAYELIARGFLTRYRAFCPSTDIDFSDVPIGAAGDYSLPKLRAVTHKSQLLVGDVVKHYKQHAEGELGITFAVDIESAKEISRAFNAARIPAEVITSKTPIGVRVQLMRQFRRREILELVSVDCLGEGVDVPAVRVVSLARRTASFQVFAQQTGRSLRTSVTRELAAQWGTFSDAERRAHIAASDKPDSIIIDHVGNLSHHAERYGLPDSRIEYTLDKREARSRPKPKEPAPRTCMGCTQPYNRFLLACPYCGTLYVPAGRATPEQVEGDLVELDPEMLRVLRGNVDRVDAPVILPQGVTRAVEIALTRSHHARYSTQQNLRKAMMVYGGWREHLGETIRTAQKRFFYDFGIDYLSAMALGSTEASVLETRISTHLQQHNVTEAAP